MSQPISLKDAERKVFTTTFNDGLWDILVGSFFLMFAVAPFLSSTLGDFWSSALFLPILGLMYLIIRQIRKHVVIPRVGRVRFGTARTALLRRFNLVMLAFNFLALILGLLAMWNFGRVPGQVTSVVFGLFLLLAFSIAAYFLSFHRLFLYGLLIGLAPLIGEWLFLYGRASHHGFPLTFGAAAGVMILVGLSLFIRFLHNFPSPTEDVLGEGS